MTEARTFAEVIGARIRARRDELELSQDELARRTSRMGLSFTRSVIDSIERGMRELQLHELVVLLAMLEIDLGTLLDGAGLIRLDDNAAVEGDSLVGHLLRQDPIVVQRDAIARPATVAAVAEVPTPTIVSGQEGRVTFTGSELTITVTGIAEEKAARKLGVSSDTVIDDARRLWGRSLTDERDARVKERAPGETSPRTVQALRGHVTRVLLEDLRKEIARRGKT
jgi:transcriptional regulator with XRE-family HTH domain